jgi:hypothetical protein
MARPIMRRLTPIVLLALVLAVLPAHGVAAQEPSLVRVTLIAQTPWSSTSQRSLDLRFRVENTGDLSLSELAIGVTMYARVLTRSAYEASLVSDPPVVIDAQTLPREGTLEPGTSRDFEVSLTLDSPGIDPEHSGVYPLKVDLRSGVASVAALRTPAIFLVRTPEVPLRLSWTFVLHHPITFAPDGTFTNASLEASLEPGGQLSGQIRALRELAADLTGTPVDVAISPVLLTQLGRMRDGYVVSEPGRSEQVPAGTGGAALARQALADLQTVARSPNVHVSALPFSAPELPALYGGGLGRDVAPQLELGREVAAAFLETTPLAWILRPPGAALDAPTLHGLSLSGISTLVVSPATIALTPQPLGLAGPATAKTEEGALTAIVPEPSLHALLVSVAEQDPVRAAQVLLGELATIWQELPGESRGVALVLSEDESVPGPFYPHLVRGIAGAPWLSPTAAGAFVQEFPPEETAPLAAPSPRRFPPTYVASLKQARRRVDTLRSMLPPQSDEPDRLDAMLLLAEARQFLLAPGDGLEFVSSVKETVDGVIASLMLDTVSAVTLTSESGGGIPVTVSNGAEDTLRFSVRLVSQYLRPTPSTELSLAPGASETLRLPAELRSTGRFPVLIQMVSPNGRVIGEQTLIVRSTAYNRIALLITIGAALVLLGLWARRFIPRRTS